jgi:hypothetical protein
MIYFQCTTKRKGQQNDQVGYYWTLCCRAVEPYWPRSMYWVMYLTHTIIIQCSWEALITITFLDAIHSSFVWSYCLLFTSAVCYVTENSKGRGVWLTWICCCSILILFNLKSQVCRRHIPEDYCSNILAIDYDVPYFYFKRYFIWSSFLKHSNKL